MSEQNPVKDKVAFFVAVPRSYKVVPVPEVGAGVAIRLRNLTARERDDYEQDVQVKTKKGYELDPVHIREKLIIRTAVKADSDELLFDESDLPRLANMPAHVIIRLFRAAQELCGLTEDPEEVEARLK